MLFKKLFISSIIFCLSSLTALAATSANYIIKPDAANSGSSKIISSNNANLNTTGILSWRTMASTNYLNYSGLLVALAGAGESTGPSIGNVRVDGREVVDNDYIKKDASLTATVVDVGSGLSPEVCSVTIDNQPTGFYALTIPSTFDAASGALIVRFNFLDGTHAIRIRAYDKVGNSSSYSRSLKVDSAVETKTSLTFAYPNPFDPALGKLKIAYQLNQEAAVDLYLFNEINQLVWSQSCPAGSTGGQLGYNEVEWSGLTNFGDTVSNGAYFLRLVSNNKIIGKMKIAVLK